MTLISIMRAAPIRSAYPEELRKLPGRKPGQSPGFFIYQNTILVERVVRPA